MARNFIFKIRLGQGFNIGDDFHGNHSFDVFYAANELLLGIKINIFSGLRFPCLDRGPVFVWSVC